MAMICSTPLHFNVNRKKPEMIRPAETTPYEYKFVSDIDDQKGHRKQNCIIHFYPYVANLKGIDPVTIVREAIAKTLVFYYPFAGRLKEGPNDKLMVECTGEGIIFIEADADVRLRQFGDFLYPPFPCVDELLYSVPGTSGILHCPLLLIQVTRLLCGGFVVATRLNHVMSDAIGFVQFMTALGEIARGASVPSVQPVWKRELLNARSPPRITCVHHAYDQPLPSKVDAVLLPHQMVHRSFLFRQPEMASLEKHLPVQCQKCSKFDLLTACLWKCRTVALDINPEDKVRVTFIVNSRTVFNPPLPAGFYGNGIAKASAVTTGSKLCRNPLEYAVRLIKRAKADVTQEFMKSMADLLVINSRCFPTAVRTFAVSDLTQIGFEDVDFGWGNALYGGPTWGGEPSCFYVRSKNHNGEEGTVVTMDLPEPAMTRFALEIKKMTEAPPQPFIQSRV